MQFELEKIFANKNILICITASIAAYKVINVISFLKKSQANIKVVMSENSKKFITPLCIEAITHTQVLHSQTESWNNPCNHIAYAKWADILLIAPASANTIAKIAHGIADNILLATILACSAKKILAPAMNTQMLIAPQTTQNIKILREIGYHIIPTRTSLLACNTLGDGAMAEEDEIYFHLAKALLTHPYWQDKRVIITGGGSKESIDSVRYISNHSSGLQATALALVLYFFGAEVNFISSIFPIRLPQEIQITEVQNTQDYYDAIQKITKDTTQNFYLFMAAAIADFKPENPKEGKIKKQNLQTLDIHCIANLDILYHLTAKNIIKIGFKAEMDSKNALHSAKKMLENKQCAYVCLNILTQHNTFGSKNNQMLLLSPIQTLKIPLKSKLDVAFDIANFIANT